MTTDKFISRRQLMALAFVGILSAMTRLLPGAPAQIAGNAAWLAPVAAAPVCVLYFRMLSDMNCRCSEGQGMCELLDMAWGRKLGGVAALIVALWLMFYCGFTLRNASERILSAVYNSGSTWLFSLVLTVMAVIAARGTLRSLARSAQIFALLGGVILAPLLLISAFKVKAAYLLPVTAYDLPEILLSAIAVVNLVSYFGYFTFLYGYTRRCDSDGGVTMRWMAVALGAAFALIFTTVGSMSPALCARLQSPFFIMIRNITLFGVAERVEALVLGIWVITDFVFLAGQIMTASYILSRFCSRIRRQDWCLLIGAVSYGVSFALGSSAFDLRMLSRQIVPLTNMILLLAVLPAAWLTLKIKDAAMKRRTKKAQN